jgi:O6-methylguanine-DNA--protein-cysteine methyltransferase
MANATTVDKVRRAAKFLATPSAISARDYLEPPYQLALRIIDQFADGTSKDLDQLTELTGINKETIRQYLRALEKGGYPLQFTYAAIKAKTGRKPVVIRARSRI